jgi:hypothetical protein
MLLGQLKTMIIGLILAGSLAGAAIADDGLPLFASDDTLHITIEGPLTTLIRERSTEEYYEGVLRFPGADGAEKALDLKFRARGNYRRRKSTCRFPPVRLNLKKKQATGTVFEGQNILKLVTHCRPGSSKYEQYVLREELAYRILNLHTPVSFRSRLLRVTWVDSENDNNSEERYGFLIEHKNEVSQRVGMEDPAIQRASYDDLDPGQAAIAAVFEYMIGNTDFSMVAGPANEGCCHNGILLRRDDGRIFFAPYDFDMAGIVDAPYAEPNPRFDLRSVTSRLYRGNCRFNPQLDDTVALYLDKRDEVLALVDTQEGLADRDRRVVRRFLERFYEDLENPKRVDLKLRDACI